MSDRETREAELRAMSDRIAELVEKHPGEMRPVLTFMGRIIAQLITDQRVVYLVESQLIELAKSVREHEKALFGGADDKPSFAERLRGIEESIKSDKQTRRTIMVGVIGLLIKAGYDLLVTALPHIKP